MVVLEMYIIVDYYTEREIGSHLFLNDFGS
jgi:hypothetical protein